MKPPNVISATVFCLPDAELSAQPEGEAAPVLKFPLLVPVDLSESHGVNITPARLAEMAKSYDPTVEQASLNFDHIWGGPSHGWCERVWLEDEALWVQFGNLSQAAIDGVRSRQYTRRSAEFLSQHPVTGGWYLTGVALLGNARPAVPGLPPVSLAARYVLTNPKPQEVPVPEKKADDPTAPPAPDPATPPPATPGAAELSTLRAQVEEGRAELQIIRRQRAELEADQALAKLGARLTPAMAKLARPLLIELMAAPTPATVQLQDDPAKPAAPVGVADRILKILSAVPEIEALTAGRLADGDDDAPPASSGLSAERDKELRAKYRYDRSWGFRQGGTN